MNIQRRHQPRSRFTPPSHVLYSPAQMRVSLNVLNALFAYAAGRGFDRDAVLAAGGLSPAALNTSDERVPSSVLFGVHRALDTLTEADTWALGVADAVPKGSYGIAEYIFRSQPSLLDSFHVIVRYSCLLSEVSQLGLRTAGTDVVFEAVHVDPELRGPNLHRTLYQTLLSSIMHVAREITTPEFAPFRVTLPFEPPSGDTSKYRAVFGCIPEFETSPAALHFDAATLASVPRAADPNLSSILQSHADELISRVTSHDEFVNQVRRVLLQQLHGRDSSLHAIARLLSTSNRSLQRRLADSGYTFKTLLDETRYDLARQYLSDSKISIDEIAFLLGYSDNSAFVKAFKRWGEVTPGEYRTRHRSGAPALS